LARLSAIDVSLLGSLSLLGSQQDHIVVVLGLASESVLQAADAAAGRLTAA
jgi:hypothetical protein